MKQHTLSVTVEDKPGGLARVSAMFSNQGFNIPSLAVGPTNVEGRSRITLVVDAPELEQLKKRLDSEGLFSTALIGSSPSSRPSGQPLRHTDIFITSAIAKVWVITLEPP